MLDGDTATGTSLSRGYAKSPLGNLVQSDCTRCDSTRRARPRYCHFKSWSAASGIAEVAGGVGSGAGAPLDAANVPPPLIGRVRDLFREIVPHQTLMRLKKSYYAEIVP